MKVEKLQDVCLISKGKTITKATSVEGNVPVIGGGLGPTYYHNIANVKTPVITISASGANAGFVNFWDEPIWASDCSTIIEKPGSPAIIGYIYKFLQGSQEFINSKLRKGSAQPHVYSSDIGQLRIPLPSINEQKQIVEKLDKTFVEIASLEKNLQLKEGKTNQLLQSILSAAFTNTEKFDVKVVKLESIVDILDNLRQPINSTERSGRIGKIPYYGATGQVGTIDRSIFNENLLLLGEDGVPFFDHNKHKAYEISGPSWVNNHAHVLRAKTSHVIQKYLLYFLNNFNYSGYVNGATRLKLTQGDMKRIPVPLPTLVNQEIIVGKLDKAYDEVQKLRNQFFNEKELISSLRQSILNNAFSFEENVA
jgi:restriction endonuclease S subunit